MQYRWTVRWTDPWCTDFIWSIFIRDFWTDYIDPQFTNQKSIKMKNLSTSVPRHAVLLPIGKQYFLYIFPEVLYKCTYTYIYILKSFSQKTYSIINILFCLSLWSENIHSMILVLWNLLRVAVCGLFLCSMCTWEKCILITYFVRSQLLIMLVKSLSSDFLICFSHLLLIVDLFFHLVLVSLALYLQDTTLLGVYRFRIVISSCWIDPFVIIKSLSRVVFLALKSIFFWQFGYSGFILVNLCTIYISLS